jgi:hypothetical protein
MPLNIICIIVVHRYINIYHAIFKKSILFTEIPYYPKYSIDTIHYQTTQRNQSTTAANSNYPPQYNPLFFIQHNHYIYIIFILSYYFNNINNICKFIMLKIYQSIVHSPLKIFFIKILSSAP